jgi:hypothetical protein
MSQTILLDTSVIGRGQPFAVPGGNPMRSIQISIAGMSWVGCAVKLYGCNDLRYPVELFTANLGGTSSIDSDVFEDNSQFAFYYAEITTIWGTSARVTVAMSARGTVITPVVLLRDVGTASVGPMINAPTIQDRQDNIRSLRRLLKFMDATTLAFQF